MSEVLGSILWMIVALGVLVTFHEFGHFWVARRCGVKVLRFSVGFGKPLWSRRDRHGTEFAIAPIPLGGYVKMLDEDEGDVAIVDRPYAFNRKSVWQRIAIVAAGPIANLLLCVALLWAMFVIGRPDHSATLGAVQGIAAESGLRTGDRIEAVDGRPTPTWLDALQTLTIAAIDRRDVRIDGVDADGHDIHRQLALSRLPVGFNQENVGQAVGLGWMHRAIPSVIGDIAHGSPADGVLKAGDQITAIDGQPVRFFNDIGPLVRALGERGGAAMVEVDRQGERHAFELTPRLEDTGRGKAWILGVMPVSQQTEAPFDTIRQFGPLESIPAAFRETARMATESLGMMRRMVTGQASTKAISGPLTIARTANHTAKLGLGWFLYFLALVSLSLAILNLMPIPVLDGGHLLYYLIELVKGSPLSEHSRIAGQYIGLAMLAGLMGLAFYNDIFRW